MNPTWSYRVLTVAEGLDELGRRGWELVAVVPGPDGRLLHYLKRPEFDLKERITNEQRASVYAQRGLTPPQEETP